MGHKRVGVPSRRYTSEFKVEAGKAGAQRWDVGGESPAWNTGFEFIQLGEA
jgi:hypothetical protein